MNLDKILKDIQQRKFEKIYFLCGNEPYYIDLISNKLIESVLKDEEKEFNQSIFYGLDTDVETVVADSRKYPMMSEYNFVVVKEAQHLKEIDRFESYFSNPISSTILVICYKNKKVDGRKKIYKSLNVNGLYYETKKLYDNQVPDWIISRLGRAGFHISLRNAALITEYLGNDLSHISNELGKIILNLPDGSTVNGDAIQEYIGINKEYNTFELNNALGYHSVLKANRIIHYFGQNEKKYPLLLIIANLYSFFSKVLKYHYTQGMSKGEKAAFIGASTFFLKDYEYAVKVYSKRKLVSIINILYQYDKKAKGIDNPTIPGRELLKEMVYRILH